MADLLMLGGGSGGGTTLTGTGIARNTGACTELSGDVTTSGSNATTLKNTGTAGTYTKVTTDAQGRVSSGTTLTESDLPSITPPTGAGFWGYAFLPQQYAVSGRTSPNGAVANKVQAYLFYIPRTMIVDHVQVCITTGVAASTGDVGIYNASGSTLLANTGGFSTATATASGGTNRVALSQGSVTFTPGYYWFAQTNSSTTVIMASWPIQITQDMLLVLQGGGAGNGQFITAGNSATAGVLPSGLGTLTNQATATPINPQLAWFCK